MREGAVLLHSVNSMSTSQPTDEELSASWDYGGRSLSRCVIVFESYK